MSKHLRVAAVGAMFLVIAATATTGAWVDSASRTTYATFNRPIALPGVQLNAGTYIFELVLPATNSNIVRVLSRDRSRVYLTAFTMMVRKPHNLKDMVTFGEAQRGMAPPITAWYPPEDGSGRQFIYR